jgi:acyl carrier protein
MDAYCRVAKMAEAHLGLDKGTAQANMSFIDDLGADSLDLVELIMAFEEEFAVEVPDSTAETWITVGDAVRYAEKIESA